MCFFQTLVPLIQAFKLYYPSMINIKIRLNRPVRHVTALSAMPKLPHTSMEMLKKIVEHSHAVQTQRLKGRETSLWVVYLVTAGNVYKQTNKLLIIPNSMDNLIEMTLY